MAIQQCLVHDIVGTRTTWKNKSIQTRSTEAISRKRMYQANISVISE